jgi:YD repeat-containing protein
MGTVPNSRSTHAAYDALDRVTAHTTPDGSVTLLMYNEAGLLETLSGRLRGGAAATPFVTSVDYNARGQRTRVEHGTVTVTDYAYDAETFRLARQTLTRPGPDPILQDLGYTKAAAGNLVQISDGAPFGSAAVSADGLYE